MNNTKKNVTAYDRFILACAVNDARNAKNLEALAGAIREMQTALDLDPVYYTADRICLLAENIIANA